MSIKFLSKKGIDTSDADAVNTDLVYNKTAYVKEKKIIGTLLLPEPLYLKANIIMQKTSLSFDSNIYYFSNIDNIFTYTNSYGNKGYIFMQDGYTTKTLITKSSCYYSVLIDKIEDDIYYSFVEATGYTTSISIYKYNIKTKEDILYWKITGLQKFYNQNLIFIDKSVISTTAEYLILDIPNKEILKRVVLPSGTLYLLTKKIGSTSSTPYKIVNITDGNSSTVDNRPVFINEASDKIIINDTLYELLADMTLGPIIKENISNEIKEVKIDNDGSFLHIGGDYYFYVESYKTKGKGGYLFIFNEDTNTFQFVKSLSGICRGGYDYTSLQWHYNYNNTFAFITIGNTDILKGYRYNNVDLYLESDNSAISDEVLKNKRVYNDFGETIIGTMPDNGKLEYAPSMEEQIIPQGYTSGGTIHSISDENLIPENIKKDITILGVTGTYEAENI